MTPKELAELEGISVAAATKRLQRQKKMSSSGQGGQVDIAKVDKCPVDNVDISEMSSPECPVDTCALSTSGQVDISEMSSARCPVDNAQVDNQMSSSGHGSVPEPANLGIELAALRDRVDSLESAVEALRSALLVLQSVAAPGLTPTPVASARFIPPPESGLKPDFVVEYEGQPKAQVVPSQVQIVIPERGARPEPGPDELRRKEFYDESMSALLKAKKPAYSIHVDRIVDRLGIEPNANGYFTRAQVAEVANA